MRCKKYFTIGFLVVLTACTKYEDAELTDRNTFVHFYSSASNYIGYVAEPDTDGGFILSGEVSHDNGFTDALIIKTNARGQMMWQTIIPDGLVKAIKPTANGYVLVGDSIKLSPSSPEVHELVNSYARLILMDSKGTIVGQHITSGSITTTVNNVDVILNVDYHGDAVALDHQGNIVVLGSFREPGKPEASFLSAFNPSDISDSLWYRSNKSLQHDYINCNALHITPSSGIVWAAKMHMEEQNISRQFFSIPYLAPNSAQINNSVYGESDSRNHAVEDIQKSSVGYGAIGTYSETNGLNANMYFIRIDANLNVIPESERYIDGEHLLLNDSIMHKGSKTFSSSYDEGLAIVATSDGYVLAGTMTSTPSVGNGGKDILLVKVDPFGDLLWKKLIGGTGDEVVSSIRETGDKGLLIFGTNTINGLSSMMLIKTDRNGNLDN